MMPIAAAGTPPDAPSVPAPPVMVAPPVTPMVVDQFDFGGVAIIAIVDGVRRRGVELVEDATRVRHPGNRVDRPDDRCGDRSAGQAENSGEEYSSIHAILQCLHAPAMPINTNVAEWLLNGSKRQHGLSLYDV